TVVAPISGVLNRMPMEVGEYAVPGDCVAEIVDMDPAKVIENVPERDVHYLKVGDPAEIFVHAPDETRLAGVIAYISELADESTRTTRLEITVENPDRLLRCGQIVRARLTRRVLEDVIMIPLDAVIPLEDGKAVYVVVAADQPPNEPGSEGTEPPLAEHAERRDVEIGFLKGRNVRILSGLEVGDRLIVAGHRYVGPGQPVAVMEEE
ncbi:MAG: efflux RND transporter periplasmic adaptor subunit, partial [Phycisphaerales bacterium]